MTLHCKELRDSDNESHGSDGTRGQEEEVGEEDGEGLGLCNYDDHIDSKKRKR
jgi:hypothetical protein